MEDCISMTDGSTKLLFIDTETGGLNPFRHSLFQVGLVVYENGRIIDELDVRIKRESYSMTANALNNSRLDLYNDIYKKGCSEEGAVKKIIRFVKENFQYKPMLAGHNLSLDRGMLEVLLNGQGVDINALVSHRMLDTMGLLWGLCIAGKIPLEACSSSGGFKYFEIDVGSKHDALEDCKSTVKLFENIIKLL